jgi:ferredoxin
MNKYYSIKRENWEADLIRLSDSFSIYAAAENGHAPDYEVVSGENIASIVYNKPKPSTPLKTFFLPVRENVTSDIRPGKQRIIIGVPNCDAEALALLDEIYLDSSFEDIYYRHRRENTFIISSDCFDILEHCHCVSYNIMPWAGTRADLALILKGGEIFLRVITQRGEELIRQHFNATPSDDNGTISWIENRHREIVEILERTGKGLPDYKTTGHLVSKAGDEIWKRHSARCVSCGACTAICPTCTCFLLIDKPGFHKVKQLDACQYPGFERVAGGEDALSELPKRFRNRYMCKYVWKPAKFSGIACTGCGRCIEACIGKINKNEIFRELAK